MKKYLIAILLVLVMAVSANAKVLSYPILSGSDDGQWSTYWNSTMVMPYVNTTRASYLRWLVNIPTGATITSATVSFKVASGSKLPISISLIDPTQFADFNCPAFSTDPSAYTLLGDPIVATPGLTGTWSAGETVTTPDLSSFITAYQAAAGYASGKYFAIKMSRESGTGYGYVYGYEQGTGYAPTLEITYTSGDVVIDLWLANPQVRSKQYIYPRVANHDAGDVVKVYLDNVEKYSYTMQASDVQANPADFWQKEGGYLLDYTGLTAGEHHIDIVVKQGETTRGTYTKTWTTLHNGYPKVGINENNAICLRNEAGDGCNLFFPINAFMYDWSKFMNVPFGDRLSYGMNGISGRGSDSTNSPYTMLQWLKGAGSITDEISGLKWKSFMTLMGEYITAKRGLGYPIGAYTISPVAAYAIEPNGHIYKSIVAGWTYQDTELGRGTTTTNVKYRDFLYTIGGTQYRSAGDAVGVAFPAATIPQNKWGLWRLSIVADGTVTVTPAADNATGYANLSTYALQAAVLPDLPANSANMGWVSVISTAAGGFVAGTTALNATGVTAKYQVEVSGVPTYCTYSGTSGVLVSGNEYYIREYKGNDDFTNIGAASNATGVRFTASGTTPTHWEHESVISCVQRDGSVYWAEWGLYETSNGRTGSIAANSSGCPTPATSGSLISGANYQINTFVAGDSFTNVGAASNATGVLFVATGTTPTNWTHGSTLTRIVSSFECSYTRQLKNDPGLLGWLWEDEPNIGGPTVWKTPNPWMKDNYEATKAADTDHPHLVGFGGYQFMYGYDTQVDSIVYPYLTNGPTFSGVRTWLYDIVGGDIYPYGFVPIAQNMETWGNTTLNLETAMSAEDTHIANNYGLAPIFGIPCPTEVTHYRSCNAVYAAGTGYTPATGLATTGGTGTGLTVDVISVSGGAISTFIVNSLGTGYKESDIITVVQGANTTGQIKLNTIMPTGPQLKNELWLRTIHGAKGIEYFNYFCPKSRYQDIETTAFKVLLESGTPNLATVILQAKSTKYTPETRTVYSVGAGNVVVPLNHAIAVAGTDGRVDYMIREYNGETWVFAARVKTRGAGEEFTNCSECAAGNTGKEWPDYNNTNTKATVIPVAGLAASTTVTVYGEGRTISSANGSFTDDFTDYDVHVYRMGIEAEADTTAPVITDFTIPTTSDSLTVPISTFTASDAVGVTGYCVTSTNSSAGCSWSGTAQTSITFASDGNQTAYAWCKDAANNISTAATDTVIIDTTAEFTLTVSKSGTGSGTITSALGGINCGNSCSAIYAEDTVVTLTATASGIDTFDGWSGGGCSGTSTCVVTMTTDIADIVATFTTGVVPTYTVFISYAGAGTGITSPAPASFQKEAGQAINISQTPTLPSTFTGWSGTCGCTGTSTCTSIMPATNCTVIATWTAAPTVTSSVVGSVGGTISPSGAQDILSSSTAEFNYTSNNGWKFKAWAGTCGGSGTTTYTTSAITEACTVTAEFEQIKLMNWVQ